MLVSCGASLLVKRLYGLGVSDPIVSLSLSLSLFVGLKLRTPRRRPKRSFASGIAMNNDARKRNSSKRRRSARIV